MKSFLSPLLRGDSTAYLIENTRTHTVVAEHVLTAFDSVQRRKGLLGRDSLAEGSALVIAPCNAVHTFFMRFPIDILFVARDGRVVKARPVVRPSRIAFAVRAFAVIELPAGALARSSTAPGDLLICRAGSNDSVRRSS
jgi:uncharacterized membrane protein (UPF0127 family)